MEFNVDDEIQVMTKVTKYAAMRGEVIYISTEDILVHLNDIDETILFKQNEIYKI